MNKLVIQCFVFLFVVVLSLFSVDSTGLQAVNILLTLGQPELKFTGHKGDTDHESFCVDYSNLYPNFYMVSIFCKRPFMCDL